MKEIPLTQGKVALVDDEDYEKLMQYKWYANKMRNVYYAVRGLNINGKQQIQSMHKMLMECPANMNIDHIDGNGLNNQKDNLRIVTIRQNQQNQHIKNTSSKYPGVYWHKGSQKWRSQIRVNGKRKQLGEFTNEVDAFRAYYDFVISLGDIVLGFEYPKQENSI